MRDVAARAEVPALHPALEEPPPRERPRPIGVEHPVRVPGLHAVEVEAVPVVEPDRERVVADLPVEPGVDPARAAFAATAVGSGQVVAEERGHVPQPVGPVGRVLAGHEKDRRERAVEPLAQAVHDPRVEEDADRELVGEDEPGAAHHVAARTPSSAPIRPARDVPSSPWKPSASAGVPHAGQPSTPNTVTERLAVETPPERVAERADRRVILEHEHLLEGRDLRREPLRGRSGSATAWRRPGARSPRPRRAARRRGAPRAGAPARTRAGPRRALRAGRRLARPRARTRQAARSGAGTARSRAGSRRSRRRPRSPSGRARASPRRSPAARSSCSAAPRAARRRAGSGATSRGRRG